LEKSSGANGGYKEGVLFTNKREEQPEKTTSNRRREGQFERGINKSTSGKREG